MKITIDILSKETYIFYNSANRRVAIERLQRAGTEWKTGRYEDREPHLGEVILNRKVGMNVCRR